MKFSSTISILASVFFLWGCDASQFDIEGGSSLDGALSIGAGDNNNPQAPGDGNGNNDSIGDGNGADNNSGDSVGNQNPPVQPALDLLRGIGVLNTNGDVTNPISTVRNVCNSRSRKVRISNINFPSSANACNWGENGNLDPRNFFFQARTEQIIELRLPAGAVICDMDFNFQPNQFFYDDQFVLSLNDTVLTSSFDYSNLLNPGDNGLTLYNWNDIAGTSWQFDLRNQYCATLPGTPSSCVFPSSDESGRSNMEFSEEHIMTVMGNGVPSQGEHFFRLSAIGDNDSSDCTHAGLNFGVTIEYVE